jgi:hypothetical protein
VDSPAPASGIVEASAPLCLVDEALSRFDGKVVIVVRDLESIIFLCCSLVICSAKTRDSSALVGALDCT